MDCQVIRFNYMAISDDRQRMMPTGKERAKGRKLDYPEAVRLPNNFGKLRIGFWLITPSSEFRAGGPLKQELTSHVGPTTLSVSLLILHLLTISQGIISRHQLKGLFVCHYTGSTLAIKLKYGEYWKKVYGPASIERRTWPYDFPRSQDYPHAYQRGTVIGRMLVQDRYVSKEALIVGNDAYVGLAPEGEAGSWQKNSKGYQFWNQSDDDGYFVIRGIRSGSYNLYYWIPGFIGDSKYSYTIHISEGDFIKLGDVVYEAPRNGPTLWEIGIPDRTAAEFYVPDPYPNLVNHLFMNHTNDRQYGLWDRYTDLYPENDLVYNVGASDYRKDWFFAHVNRKLEDGSYGATTWRIVFNLTNVSNGSYTLWLALATANGASIKVNFNEQPNPRWLSFRTGLIGRDNAIARHGIHGFYRLYSFNVPSFLLGKGANVISLHQENGRGKFYGVMYDYIRFEGPPEIDLIFNLKN
ncbi:Carbohydrate-binding-like fold [Cynara cardunculus var. scolymus]|uniref:Carbohydrate-binding-like fold n=1 Tax=Cynara cardunculus var. scolymus TaxID=59895 RepID=A0A103YGI3_CYNCS|nr:Carbohydrate-binding-like fold [Cynara cardunculus var. scolymus]